VETIDSLAPPPTFQLAIAKNLPILSAKRLLLTQVFANPIGNAIKHHDRIEGAIHIANAERSDVYEFAIADDDAGIPPEQHDPAIPNSKYLTILHQRSIVSGGVE
jgi:signal transduction histidine kinase